MNPHGRSMLPDPATAVDNSDWLEMRAAVFEKQILADPAKVKALVVQWLDEDGGTDLMHYLRGTWEGISWGRETFDFIRTEAAKKADALALADWEKMGVEGVYRSPE